MSAQEVTLWVAFFGFLGTLSVQTINYLSSIHIKAIDEKQKQEDRRLELRKLYLARKLEAGEKIIARRNKLVTNIEYNLQHYKRFADSARYFDAKFTEVLEESTALGKADRGESSAFLLYFNAKRSDEAQSIANELNDVKQDLTICLQERRNLLKIDVEKAEASGFDVEEAFNKKQQEIEKLLLLFISASEKLKNALVQSCEDIRESLKEYELY